MQPVITYVGSISGAWLKLVPRSSYPKQLLVLYNNGSLLQREVAEDKIIPNAMQRSGRMCIQRAALELGLTGEFRGEGLDEVGIVIRVHGIEASCKQGDLIINAYLLYFCPTGVEPSGATPPSPSWAGNPPHHSRNSFGGWFKLTRYRRGRMVWSRGPGFRRSITMKLEWTYASSPPRVHNRLSCPALPSSRGACCSRVWLECTDALEKEFARVNRQVQLNLCPVLVRSYTEHCTFAENRCNVRNSDLVLPQSRDWMLAKERS
jgi:hypothetical protein